jgi:hypothetical protein
LLTFIRTRTNVSFGGASYAVPFTVSESAVRAFHRTSAVAFAAPADGRESERRTDGRPEEEDDEDEQRRREDDVRPGEPA